MSTSRSYKNCRRHVHIARIKRQKGRAVTDVGRISVAKLPVQTEAPTTNFATFQQRTGVSRPTRYLNDSSRFQNDCHIAGICRRVYIANITRTSVSKLPRAAESPTTHSVGLEAHKCDHSLHRSGQLCSLRKCSHRLHYKAKITSDRQRFAHFRILGDLRHQGPSSEHYRVRAGRKHDTNQLRFGLHHPPTHSRLLLPTAGAIKSRYRFPIPELAINGAPPTANPSVMKYRAQVKLSPALT